MTASIAGLRGTSRQLRELERQIASQRRLIAEMAGHDVNAERARLGHLLAELDRLLRGGDLTLPISESGGAQLHVSA